MRMEKMLKEPRNLVDLIYLVKPRVALFTTYTFSVSHFDAVILPALRSVGCQDVSVLVDAEQAATSVQELHSPAAGRVYRIAPVLAPGGGVFHPKLAYFASESDDVLTVASANLTASGQSLQLESFDVVSAKTSPTVFRDLAKWMQLLASMVQTSSLQAARLLTQTAARALYVHGLNAAAVPTDAHMQPHLVHTLTDKARNQLEALYTAEVGVGDTESLVVLAPFHAPDGGPLRRLAKTVKAKSLVVGLDGARKNFVAPFSLKKSPPEASIRFVVPDTPSRKKRLHAKVFEIHSKDKVLVMTGSVNATVQSFESTRNVELSLVRWLPTSPFAWKTVKPSEYKATQDPSCFGPGQALYVDAWLDTDRMVCGRISASGPLPRSINLQILRGDEALIDQIVSLDDDGAILAGPFPPFDTSKASQLKVTADGMSASCWLNVQEELDIAAEERERRAAIARVLRGEFAAEDIAEVVQLLFNATNSVVNGVDAPQPRNSSAIASRADAKFSFMRWESSGHGRSGNTTLDRRPYELLKALNRWLQAEPGGSVRTGSGLGAPSGLTSGLQLLGDEEDEQRANAPLGDPYEFLDKLCVAIPKVLEERPELEYADALAEVVASRAVNRSFREDLKMGPCVSWLDRFSRFAYADKARKELGAIAAALACLVANRLEGMGENPQLSTSREAVERVVGSSLNEAQWVSLSKSGLERDLFRRVVEAERHQVLAMAARLASAVTVDDSLLALLRKALKGTRTSLTREPEAGQFPTAAAALRERPHGKAELLQGVLRQLDFERRSCPFCYTELSKEEVVALRQRHVLVHKGSWCNRLLFYPEHRSHFVKAIEELPNA